MQESQNSAAATATDSDMSTNRPTVQVLGRTAAFAAGQPVTLSERGRALLAALIAAGPAGATVEQLAEDLWLDARPEGWRPALRMAVARLRKRTPAGIEVVGDSGGYRLVPTVGWIDAWALESLADDWQPISESALGWALAGAPFIDVDPGERVAARGRYLKTLQLRVVQRFCAQEPALMSASTCAVLTELLHRHPYDDELAIVIAQTLIAAGRRSEALSALTSFSHVYQSEIGPLPIELVRVLATRGSQLLDQVLISSPDVVFLKTPDGYFLGANRAFANLIGIPREKLLGMSEREMISDPEFLHEIEVSDREVVETAEPYRASWRNHDPVLDRTQWFDVVKSPIFGPGGEVTALYCVARDVTPLREAEYRVKLQNRWLEALNKAIVDKVQTPADEVDFAPLMEAICSLTNASFAVLFARPATVNPDDQAAHVSEIHRFGEMLIAEEELHELARVTGQDGAFTWGKGVSAASFPIQVDSGRLGVVVLGGPGEPTDAELSMSKDVCRQIAMLLVHRNLVDTTLLS